MLHRLGKGKETEIEQSPGSEVPSLLAKVTRKSELHTLQQCITSISTVNDSTLQ